MATLNVPTLIAAVLVALMETVAAMTPLMVAARGNNVKTAQALLAGGANIDSRNNPWGSTALAIAATNGHRQMTEELIRNHANLDLQSFAGWTPLMQAAEKGHIESAKALISHHPNLDLKNGNGETALMIAVRCRQLNVAEEIGAATAGADNPHHYEQLGVKQWWIAKDKGARLGLLPGKSLGECKRACDVIPGCRNFAWCPRDHNNCLLYDEQFTGQEPTQHNGHCNSFYRPIVVSGRWHNLLCHGGGAISRTVEAKRAITKGSTNSWGWNFGAAVSAGIEYDTPGKSLFGGATVTASMEISAGLAHDWSTSIEHTTEDGVSFTVNCPRHKSVCLWQWELKFTTDDNTAVWDSHHTRCTFSGISSPPDCPPGMFLDQGKDQICKDLGGGYYQTQEKFNLPMALDATTTMPRTFGGLPLALTIFVAGGLGMASIVWRYRRYVASPVAQSTTGLPFIDDVE